MTKSRIRIALRIRAALLAVAWAALPAVAAAQTTISEDFTGTTVNNSWTAINGACLTGGTEGTWYGPGGATLVNPSSSTSTSGYIPACVGLKYYTANGDAYQVGGENGALGNPTSSPPSSNKTQIPDNQNTASGYACSNSPPNCAALRLTNGAPNYHESGAIISNTAYSMSSGLQVTFKTVTYLGNKGGTGGDGADGISFSILDANPLDASYYVAGSRVLGAWGGSLGYSCSNSNPPYNGQVGAFLGLGIDEYGNFLNQSDNTASGVAANGWGSGDYQWNRIGMRGPGNVAWTWLNANYPNWYPSSLTTANNSNGTPYSEVAVQSTCETGTLWNYSTPGSPVNKGVTSDTTSSSGGSGAALYDYVPIPNGSAVIPETLQIANETAATRSAGTPIYYVLNITPTGLLSLSYSVGGGTLTSVLSNQSIVNSSTGVGLPSSVYFGFEGSTGGSDNVHEIMCFQAAPSDQSASSTTVNLPQDKLVSAGEVYLPSYHTANWWGQLTSQSLLPTSNPYVLTVSTTINWDAACVLSGSIVSSTECSTISNSVFESPSSRTILTWSGSQGIAFEWPGGTADSSGNSTASSVTAAERAALNLSDSTGNNRLAFLRGDRTNECPSTGCSSPTIYRDRTAVLGDIVHSSPDWVGPPAETGYEISFADNLYPSSVAAENQASAQTYQGFYNAYVNRESVVYIGSNDGFLHGFDTGLPGSSSNVDNGYEVLAYMPQVVLDQIHSSSPLVDYSSPNYSHAFGVDAAPDADDIFFNNRWHTWLVGGLGAGGSAIYALDVTDPTGSQSATSTLAFSEGDAANIVIGEWTPSNLSCANASNCGAQLNNTYGTPVMWRFHAVNSSNQNKWGVIFGNGLPNQITATMGTGVTGTVSNNDISGYIGDWLGGTVNGKTVTQTSGGAVLAKGNTISGTDIKSGTTVSSVSSPCTPTNCTYTLSQKSTATSSTAWSYLAPSTTLYVSSGVMPTSFPSALTDSDGKIPSGTTITGYVGTSGSYQVYTVNTSLSVTTEQMITTGLLLQVSAGAGLSVGAAISDAAGNIPAGTTIASFGTGTGSSGTYYLSQGAATGSENISVTVGGKAVWWMLVAAGNGLATGQTISAPGVASGTTISSMGNSSGGPGYYILSKSQTAQAGSPLALGTGLTGITSETMFNQNPNANGDAGIYVMLVDPASGSTPSISFYYLDTGYGPSQDPLQLNRPNGIAYAAPVDLDGDNTVDYVYAGDVFGNLWRFDLTSSSASNWTVSSFAGGSSTTPSPLFSAGSTGGTYPNLTDQPITTRPLIVTVPGPNGSSAVMVEFGTGQEIPFNPVSAVSYAGGTQALYGIWDWNMNAWNSLSHMSLASLGSSGLSGGTITPSSANLAQQQLTVICAISSCVSTPSNPNLETVTSNPVCWYGASACSSGNTQYGWELPFNATQSPGEQVIYNPGEWQGVLQVNTTIPAPSTIYSCTIDLPTGYTMFLNPATGGSLTTSAWLGSNGSPLTTGGGAVVTGEELGAVGTGTVITTSSGVSFDVNQLSGGGASANATKGVSTSAGHTVTWTQLR